MSDNGTRAGPDRVFFLDDEDLSLVRRRRGDHMRAGFALPGPVLAHVRGAPGWLRA